MPPPALGLPPLKIEQSLTYAEGQLSASLDVADPGGPWLDLDAELGLAPAIASDLLALPAHAATPQVGRGYGGRTALGQVVQPVAQVGGHGAVPSSRVSLSLLTRSPGRGGRGAGAKFLEILQTRLRTSSAAPASSVIARAI